MMYVKYDIHNYIFDFKKEEDNNVKICWRRGGKKNENVDTILHFTLHFYIRVMAEFRIITVLKKSVIKMSLQNNII